MRVKIILTETENFGFNSVIMFISQKIDFVLNITNNLVTEYTSILKRMMFSRFSVVHTVCN